MPTIDELTPRTAAAVTNTDILYVGVPNDADPDRKATIEDAKSVFGVFSMVLDVTRGEDVDASVEQDAFRFVMPQDVVLTDGVASVATAPTGADLVVGVRVNSTSVFSNDLVIDDGSTSSIDSATATVVDAGVVSRGDVVRVDVDQVGSSVAGAGLKVVLVGRVA